MKTNSSHLTKRSFIKFSSKETLEDAEYLKKDLSKYPKLLLTDDILFKNETYVVSPTVFCKKLSISFLEGASARLVILENMLRIVCQAYYKSEYTIGNLIQEIELKSKLIEIYKYSYLEMFLLLLRS